jgi:hypothetical protein
MAELQARQEILGLPTAPPSVIAPPSASEVAQDAPPPIPSDVQAIEQQADHTDQYEKELVAAASPSGPSDQAAFTSVTQPPAPPAQRVNIAVGQTRTDVWVQLVNLLSRISPPRMWEQGYNYAARFVIVHDL